MAAKRASDEIKMKLPLSQVINPFVQLTKLGREFLGLCPFHNEKTPSFHVNDAKGVYYCFGCQASGDAFTFYMEQKGVDYPEAERDLARMAGVDLSPYHKKFPQAKAQTAKREKFKSEIKINQIAGLFFKKTLHSKAGAAALKYLKERNLDPKIIDDFKLGYAPEDFHALERELGRASVPKELAEKLGLLGAKKSKNSHYDTFRHRIIYPIFNPQGDVIAFGGRVLSPQDKPKYLNSKESSLFKKSATLYGLNFARKYIREGHEAILTEGYMDVLALHQAGFKNSVASLGTALTKEHIQLLKRHCDCIILMMDGDEAGVKASEKALPLILEEQIDCRIVIIPDGMDADDFLKQTDGKVKLQALIQESHHLLDHLIEVKINSSGSGLQDRIKLAEELIPWIAQNRGSIAARTIRLRDLSDRLQIPFRDMELIAKNFRGKSRPQVKTASKTSHLRMSPVRAPKVELELTRLAMRYPEIRSYLKENPQVLDKIWDHISHEECRSILKITLECADLKSISFSQIKSPELRAALASSLIEMDQAEQTPFEPVEKQALEDENTEIEAESHESLSEDPFHLLADALISLEMKGLVYQRQCLMEKKNKNPKDKLLNKEEFNINSRIHQLRESKKNSKVSLRRQ